MVYHIILYYTFTGSEDDESEISLVIEPESPVEEKPINCSHKNNTGDYHPYIYIIFQRQTRISWQILKHSAVYYSLIM